MVSCFRCGEVVERYLDRDVLGRIEGVSLAA